MSAGSPAWPAGVTDRDGRLSLPAETEGPFDLLLADGRRHKLETLPAAGRVDLPALRLLEGRVLDAAARKPLAWALVWPGDDPGNVTFTGPAGTLLFCNTAGMAINQQLAANIFNWLSERRVLLDIRGSAYVARHLQLQPQQLDRIWWFLVVGVPGAFLLLGLFVHWRRRDR